MLNGLELMRYAISDVFNVGARSICWRTEQKAFAQSVQSEGCAMRRNASVGWSARPWKVSNSSHQASGDVPNLQDVSMRGLVTEESSVTGDGLNQIHLVRYSLGDEGPRHVPDHRHSGVFITYGWVNNNNRREGRWYACGSMNRSKRHENRKCLRILAIETILITRQKGKGRYVWGYCDDSDLGLNQYGNHDACAVHV